ncbi:MAG: cytochrome C oxidase subunit IV family protein [Myxococcales bacterium]|nr:cytochrome C oxidase subunit IV family protein [Myxococcales bacterium]
MSNATAGTAATHRAATPKGEHADEFHIHPHISSTALNAKVLGALYFFTFLTVLAYRVDLGNANLAVATLISVAKSFLVCAFFMHLRYEKAFMSVALLGGIVCMGLFFGYTLNDTDHRGEANPFSSTRYNQVTGKYAHGTPEWIEKNGFVEVTAKFDEAEQKALEATGETPAEAAKAAGLPAGDAAKAAATPPGESAAKANPEGAAGAAAANGKGTKAGSATAGDASSDAGKAAPDAGAAKGGGGATKGSAGAAKGSAGAAKGSGGARPTR